MSGKLPVGWENRRKQPHRARHEAGASRWRPPRLGSPVKTAPSLPRHHRRRSRRQIPSSSLTSSNPFPEPQGAAAAGTFSSKGTLAGAYADGSETHKTTEEVEAYWMSVIEKEREESGSNAPRGTFPGDSNSARRCARREAKAYGAVDAAGPGRSAHGGPTPGTVAGTATGTGTGTGPSPARRRVRRGQARAPAGDGDGTVPGDIPGDVYRPGDDECRVSVRRGGVASRRDARTRDAPRRRFAPNPSRWTTTSAQVRLRGEKNDGRGAALPRVEPFGDARGSGSSEGGHEGDCPRSNGRTSQSP